MRAAKIQGDALAAPSFQSSRLTALGTLYPMGPNSFLYMDTPLKEDCTKPFESRMVCEQGVDVYIYACVCVCVCLYAYKMNA